MKMEQRKYWSPVSNTSNLLHCQKNAINLTKQVNLIKYLCINCNKIQYLPSASNNYFYTFLSQPLSREYL